MKKIIALFSIVIGIAVLGMWTFLLVSGVPGEGVIALSFHLYAEFAMAIVLIVSGIYLWKNLRFAVETNMGGLGMLVYSTLNAAGYYGQKEEQTMMIFFIILFALATAAISGHYYIPRKSNT